MPLTDGELAFLDAYVHELYSAPMAGPHSRALRELGASRWDLSWLLTAWHRRVLGDGKSPLGSFHSEPVPLPWSSKEVLLSRGRQLPEGLEREAGVGGDLYFGRPEDAQPDWRDGDPDDEIDDDDDPAPIGRQVLIDMLGFDPAEIEDKEEDDDDGEASEDEDEAEEAAE